MIDDPILSTILTNTNMTTYMYRDINSPSPIVDDDREKLLYLHPNPTSHPVCTTEFAIILNPSDPRIFTNNRT